MNQTLDKDVAADTAKTQMNFVELLARLRELDAALSFILENSEGRPSRICAGYRDLVDAQRRLTRALLAKADGA